MTEHASPERKVLHLTFPPFPTARKYEGMTIKKSADVAALLPLLLSSADRQPWQRTLWASLRRLRTLPLFTDRLILICRYDTDTIGDILVLRFWRKYSLYRVIKSKDSFPDSDANQTSEIVSILPAGTFYSALLTLPTADHMGHRLAMIFQAGIISLRP